MLDKLCGGMKERIKYIYIYIYIYETERYILSEKKLISSILACLVLSCREEQDGEELIAASIFQPIQTSLLAKFLV